jgi:hypothetical protein
MFVLETSFQTAEIAAPLHVPEMKGHREIEAALLRVQDLSFALSLDQLACLVSLLMHERELFEEYVLAYL